MTDANEIIHALRLWFQAGDVFEVRVLDAVSADWMRPHTESGYFDYEHIPDAAAAIGKLRAYRGAYATVNPVKPELLARAWNRIRPNAPPAFPVPRPNMNPHWPRLARSAVTSSRLAGQIPS